MHWIEHEGKDTVSQLCFSLVCSLPNPWPHFSVANKSWIFSLSSSACFFLIFIWTARPQTRPPLVCNLLWGDDIASLHLTHLGPLENPAYLLISTGLLSQFLPNYQGLGPELEMWPSTCFHRMIWILFLFIRFSKSNVKISKMCYYNTRWLFTVSWMVINYIFINYFENSLCRINVICVHGGGTKL